MAINLKLLQPSLQTRSFASHPEKWCTYKSNFHLTIVYCGSLRQALISQKQFLADWKDFSLLGFQQLTGDQSGGPTLRGLAASWSRWDLTGYFRETESLKQEAGMPEWAIGASSLKPGEPEPGGGRQRLCMSEKRCQPSQEQWEDRAIRSAEHRAAEFIRQFNTINAIHFLKILWKSRFCFITLRGFWFWNPQEDGHFPFSLLPARSHLTFPSV